MSGPKLKVVVDNTEESAQTVPMVPPKTQGRNRDPVQRRMRPGEDVALSDLGITELEAVTVAILNFNDILRETMVNLSEFTKRRDFVLEQFDELAQVDAHQKEGRHPLDGYSTVAFFHFQAVTLGKALDDLVVIVRDNGLREKLTGHPRSAFLRLEKLHDFVEGRFLPMVPVNIVSVDDEDEGFAVTLDEFMRLLVETATIVRKRRLAWAKAVVGRNRRAAAMLKMAAVERKEHLERLKRKHDEAIISQIEAQNAVARAGFDLKEVSDPFEAPVAEG
jgi:hypothetical protein